MAIRRCPYCKAIIDEEDKYCNNCGTQLLFPEDEFIEEEIPGDRIIDEEEPEETEEEETSEERELEAELEDEEEFTEGEEGDEETGTEGSGLGLEDTGEKEAHEEARETREFTGHEEEEEEEREEEEEEEEKEEAEADEEALGTSPEEPTGAEEEDDEREDIDREIEEEEVEEEEEEFGGSEGARTGEPAEPAPGLFDTVSSEEASRQAEESVEEEGRAGAPPTEGREERVDDSDKIYEVSLEEDELVFRTKDMSRPSGAADKGTIGKGSIPDTGSLPPWVSRIRETPAAVEPAEEAEAEPKPVSREWTTDSGIGIPERITQAALPFADTRSLTGPAPAQEKDHVEEEKEAVTSEVEEAARPGSFSLKLRAKAVDLVFVTALWVISLYFTAQVVGVSLFRLVFGSPLPVLGFYVILLALYFFLFLYFLGETLGDHYFSE